MEKIDTSTEAVTKLLDGVTPGPWAVDAGESYCDVVTDYGVFGEDFIICERVNQDARFIAAARDLVPALLAERDALRRENENLRQIERNVQDVREHEYKRAEAALAEVERLKAQRITVQDAARVLLTALERAQIDMETLKLFFNGQPVAALRAIAEGRE